MDCFLELGSDRDVKAGPAARGCSQNGVQQHCVLWGGRSESPHALSEALILPQVTPFDTFPSPKEPVCSWGCWNSARAVPGAWEGALQDQAPSDFGKEPGSK